MDIHERELRDGVTRLRELRQQIGHEVHPISAMMSRVPTILNRGNQHSIPGGSQRMEIEVEMEIETQDPKRKQRTPTPIP